MNSGTIRIEVACALPERQVVKALAVPTGCTAGEAVVLSGIAAQFPELDIPALRLGIFSHVVEDDQVLSDGDRVELYRPLLLDPKEARRQRAEKARRR